MKKFLITGEEGFLAKKIKESGKLDIVENKEGERTWTSEFTGGLETDILCPDFLEETIEELNPDVILHLAGAVGTEFCNKSPEEAVGVNVNGTYNVVDIAKRLNKKLIYFSTTVVFKPTKGAFPIAEDNEKDPQTLYGATKLAGEHIVKSLMPKKDYFIVRPCMVFGGDGDKHSGVNMLVKSCIEKDFTAHIALDEKFVKPFIYVDDFIKAFCSVAQNEEIWGQHDLNFCPFEHLSFGEILMKFKELGLNPKYVLHPEMDYLKHHIMDNNKFKWLCKDSPETQVIEGIKKVYDQLKSQSE